MKRSRGRGRRGGPQNHQNRAFDSAGPDIKIRGSAANIYEKYLQLARDAGSAGDRVAQENFLQHAEHYYRIMMANQPQGTQGQQGGHQHGGQQPQYQQGGQPTYNQGNYQPQSAQPNVNPQYQQPYPQQQAQPVPGSTPSFSMNENVGEEEAEEAETDEAAAS